MTTLSRRSFRRRFRRLDPPARERLIAALYEAAGWAASRRDGRVVIEREEPVRERRVLVVRDEHGAAGTERDPDPVVVVTDGTETRGTTDGELAVDVDDLYDRLRYGLPAEAAEHIVCTHLTEAGRPPGHADGRPRSWRTDRPGSVTGRAGARPAPAVRGGVRLVLVVLVVAALVAALPGGGVGPPLAYTDRGDTLRKVVTCPVPPRDLSPVALLPQVGPPPLPADDWHRQDATIRGAFDLLDRSPIATPDRMAIATYTGPADRRYRVTIGQWNNQTMVGTNGIRMGEPHVVMAWGRYTLAVQSAGTDGRHGRGAVSIAAARQVLDGVPAASAAGLGSCGAGRL